MARAFPDTPFHERWFMATVRYLVGDVQQSISFYTDHLGFKLEESMGPAFARVSKADLTL
jgi:hypothetical protein